MAWNGCTVIDMDAHIRERADKFFKDYIDPEFRAPFNRLCEAIALQEEKGDRYALFGSRSAVIEQIEAGRALGVRDTFGLTARSELEHGRIAFPPGREDPLPPDNAAVDEAESSVDPEQEAVLADSVGLALLVVLDTLGPAERLCDDIVDDALVLQVL